MRTSAPVGGATVADIRALDGEQALSIMMLRDWFDGPVGQARVTRSFTEALGPSSGKAAVTAWAAYAEILEHHTRRPVLRHDVTCQCVGSDEAVLAQTLQQAARGAREEALLILSLLVPADRLFMALNVVEDAGRAVLRLATRWRQTDSLQRTDGTPLH